MQTTVRACSLGHYSGSARTSVWQRRVLVLLVPQSRQSNHSSNLFFHQSFIPQLRDCQTGRRGIDSLLGQDHKLIAILFVAENERNKKAVPDVLHRHNAILGRWAAPRNGPSVAVRGHVCSSLSCTSARLGMNLGNRAQARFWKDGLPMTPALAFHLLLFGGQIFLLYRGHHHVVRVHHFVEMNPRDLR